MVRVPDASRPLPCESPHLTLEIEILTHIFSHLHPDSHASVALVSKRFYAIMTTPHAWRMAFLRFFPGRTILETKQGKAADGIWRESTTDAIRSEARYFPRLTPLATWRSEYLFRTRLLRSLERGKPGVSSGGIGATPRPRQSGKKVSAVLTYNSKLPWLVTNIHAVFSNGKKPPRAIQGAADLGVGTTSDPTTGKLEKWGLEDPLSFAQLDEVMPNLVPYGLSEGPTAIPNLMDVSQPYGMLAGEGFPGGRPFFRGAAEMRGRYLGPEDDVIDAHPDIPKIPELSEAVSSVWLAKSSAVPATTHAMVGMLVGSTLGVVTAYSLGWDPSSPRSNGDITARWILSPGVPIISLRVDDNYSVRRKLSGRVWAVALNALGEVFYLTEVPAGKPGIAKGGDVVKAAWRAGRTAHWHLLEATRRVARSDDLDANAIRGSYSPRSPSDSMKLSEQQMTAEAREIEKFLHYKPCHFRKVCEGWDMRRRLEVDFASDNGRGAGEGIIVIDCGMAEDRPARVQRFTRSKMARRQEPPSQASPSPPAPPSIFGRAHGEPATLIKSPEPQSPKSPPATPLSPGSTSPTDQHDWSSHVLELKGHAGCTISASALDCSAHSCLTLSEDPLHVAGETTDEVELPNRGVADIPGGRARFLAIGTKGGAVVLWNAREDRRSADVQPVRIIQTESPEISCVAMTALYLVHGGSDGLVQAWEPLASTTDPIRTLNARSNGRVPRHMMTMNPTLAEGNYSAAGAIYLDPDPTVLRGIVSFGAFMRYWTYSSAAHPTGRKRRARHSDIHGRIASRRQGGTSSRYIAAEEAELRRENEQRAREQSRLRKRFGVGALGDLTEEEALRYAQMVSEEAYAEEEQRRASDSTASASQDTASSYSGTTADTVTPEPSVNGQAGPSPSAAPPTTDDESDYEQQIQQAIRLSLLEGVNDRGQSPPRSDSGEYEFPIKYKAKGARKGRNPGSDSGSPSATRTPVMSNPRGGASESSPPTAEDEDLALALSLSMQDQEDAESGRAVSVSGRGGVEERDEFPPLETEGVGKGKSVQRW